MKGLFKTLVAFFAITTATFAGEWSVDHSHSNVGFTVSHMVISKVYGFFGKFDGSIKADNDDFKNASISFEVDINSINTQNEKRDGHLKSDDFFNAAQYDKMTFTSVSFTKVKGKKYKLVGDLTIRDVTKRVTFDVEYLGTVQGPWGNTRAGFVLSGVIDRFDYGLKWNKALETGGLVVGADVEINVNLELIKKS